MMVESFEDPDGLDPEVPEKDPGEVSFVSFVIIAPTSKLYRTPMLRSWDDHSNRTSQIIPKEMARPAGFEPATYGFEVRRSIQLSYGRMGIVVFQQGTRKMG